MILKTILVFKKTIWFVKVFGLFNKLQIFCFQKDLVPLITLQKCLKPCYLGGSGGKCQNWNWTWEYLWGSYSTFNLELKCYVQKWQGLIFVKKIFGGHRCSHFRGIFAHISASSNWDLLKFLIFNDLNIIQLFLNIFGLFSHYVSRIVIYQYVSIFL